MCHCLQREVEMRDVEKALLASRLGATICGKQCFFHVRQLNSAASSGTRDL